MLFDVLCVNYVLLFPPEVLVCVLGADINSPEEKNHWTPLHLAVQNNHPQVVRGGREGRREGGMRERKGRGREGENRRTPCMPA